MSVLIRQRRRPARALTAAVAAADCLGLLTSCGDDAAATKDKPAAAGADASATFPVSLTNAWGATEVKKKPVKVATVSDGDTAIALALGIVPVITPDIEDGSPVPAYKQRALDKLGGAKLKTYDDTDGTAYEAIATEAPDVLLVTYPFGDRGVVSAKDLESNQLFQSLNAVKGKHFTVIPSNNSVSPPSPTRTR